MWIDALQRKADEDTLVLQKLTSDWQNYSQALSAIKSNISSTAQNMRLLQNSLAAGQQRIVMSNEMYYDLTQQVCGQWLELSSSLSTLKWNFPMRRVWMSSPGDRRVPFINVVSRTFVCLLSR